MKSKVIVTGAFDDLRSRQVRFLEEASRLGPVTVCLWSDAATRRAEGSPPRFPEAERLYMLQALRFVSEVRLVDDPGLDSLQELAGTPGVMLAIEESGHSEAKKAFCAAHGLAYHVVPSASLASFPEPSIGDVTLVGRKKVLVTGCYDWFHSGHVRFFEEVSVFGDLFVVVGHDANIRLLKGGGHPLLPQAERRYLVGSVRFVREALISTGDGWLDAAPEIARIKPDIYAVNEDGDKGGKREFCEQQGMEYLVLKRTPAPGLENRTSTSLRGF